MCSCTFTENSLTVIYMYRDSYWIMEGLLLCEMNNTVRGMIKNLAQLVEQCVNNLCICEVAMIVPTGRYGLVPNGGRVYYTRRSQPPLLTQMVILYYQMTGDWELVQEVLPVLDKEYQFWLENRTVAVTLCSGCELSQYAANTTGPR